MANNSKKNFVLKQKTQRENTRTVPSTQKPKANLIPQMSPEAIRAMGLAREDAKENMMSSPSSDQLYSGDLSKNGSARLDSNNNVDARINRNSGPNNKNSTYSSQAHSANDAGRERRIQTSNNRVQRLPPRHNNPTRTASNSRGAVNNTARSRSTLSQNDAPFSTSDNTESCNHTTTASSASVYTTNNSNSYSYSAGNNHRSKVAVNMADDEDDDVGDYDDEADDEENDDVGSLPSDQDAANGNKPGLGKEKSFVMALDQALERNSISRLKGDITDTTRIHEPGTVRALDGGRLNNAQEVVVNVCHNDDKQLVFHDDDEESLDTAKEISQIRVNIWMEYNSTFPPDNLIHDFQPPEIPDDDLSSKKQSTPSTHISTGSRKSLDSGVHRARNATTNRNSRNINANDRISGSGNTLLVPATRQTKSARSGSSSSSRDPPQNGAATQKRISGSVNTKSKR